MWNFCPRGVLSLLSVFFAEVETFSRTNPIEKIDVTSLYLHSADCKIVKNGINCQCSINHTKCLFEVVRFVADYSNVNFPVFAFRINHIFHINKCYYFVWASILDRVYNSSEQNWHEFTREQLRLSASELFGSEVLVQVYAIKCALVFNKVDANDIGISRTSNFRTIRIMYKPKFC